MSHSTVAPAEVLTTDSARTRWPLLFLSVAIGALWLEVANQLRPEWTLNPQYGYGWAVPFLSLYAFRNRWLVRPEAAPPRHRLGIILLAVFTAVLVLPLRIIAIANPDWRLISWTFALVGVVITFAVTYLAGGKPWVRHFAFPILFFLVAVPWPVLFEQAVVQSLMRADSAITVMVLNAIGIVALAHGNVIELSTGMVGIDDACTGVRSLQATFMISLFLGEFYSMKASRRVILIIAGAVLAFGFNIIRTLILCLVGANSGVDRIHAWHDSAGFSILFACLIGLWVVSLRLRPKDEALNVPAPAPSKGQDRYGGLALLLAVWIGLIELTAFIWYDVRGPHSEAENSWDVTWPVTAPDYANATVPEAAKGLLQYSDGGAASWTTPDTKHWSMFYFRWLPGRSAALQVKVHRPDICLPASGMTLQQDNGIQPSVVNGVTLPIRSYRFDDNGRVLYVFYCYWDSRTSYESIAAATSEDWTAKGRLRAAWMGRRERGARMLELAVWGYEKEADARQALQKQLQQIVRSG